MIHRAVSWSRQECCWSVGWCRRGRCCSPDVYPISSDVTVWRLMVYGRLRGHTPMGCLGGGLATMIHKFANVYYIMFGTSCHIIVGFTRAAFGLDLFCYSVTIDFRWRYEVVRRWKCCSCCSCTTVHYTLGRE